MEKNRGNYAISGYFYFLLSPQKVQLLPHFKILLKFAYIVWSAWKINIFMLRSLIGIKLIAGVWKRIRQVMNL